MIGTIPLPSVVALGAIAALASEYTVVVEQVQAPESATAPTP